MKKVDAGSMKKVDKVNWCKSRSADNNKYLASMGQIKEKKIGMTPPLYFCFRILCGYLIKYGHIIRGKKLGMTRLYNNGSFIT